MRTFVYTDEKSNRFWNIDLRGSRFLVSFGKVGSRGQTQQKDFPDEEKARKAHDTLIAEKLARGYVETTPTQALNLRQSLEETLADNPDDLAAHSAYADLLTEQGDPLLAARGEFISVQLALEDPRRTTEERKRLQSRERELLDAHERVWLGELAPLLLGTFEERRALFAAELTHNCHMDEEGYGRPELAVGHSWRRGWLDSFAASALTVEMTRALGRAPIARLLRTLIYRGWFFGYTSSGALFRHADGPDLPRPRSGQFCPIEVLARYPAVRNLRSFQYGTEADPEEDTYNDGTQYQQLAPLIACMPRLEELSIFGHIYMDDEMWQDMHAILSLPTLGNLRVYRHYHATSDALEPLASNPALGRLTHLLLFPHSFSRSFDPGQLGTTNWIGAREGPALHRENVRAVVTSPHLSSLAHLQMRCCSGGDATIQDIVDSGILERLKTLDLRHGHVTDVGARLLAGCPAAGNLEILDLIDNRLTLDGEAILRAAGIRVRADRQQEPPFDDDRILYYRDSE